ncbi:MAG: chorismate mutase [Candidatus Peribacteraceae bacterium]|nr:chorismate mutase [Candidatus Peribacteraceae bacterium]MBP9850292.1 chorismate mutase [Candidatus Peribacteraceae bacterium]
MTQHLTIPLIRAAIDEADDILLKALATRFRAIGHLKDIKRDTGVQVESPSRETELKARWKKKAEELRLPTELTLLILDFILAESKKIQSS